MTQARLTFLLLFPALVIFGNSVVASPLEQCQQEAQGMDGMQACQQEELDRQQRRLDQTVSRLAQGLDASRREELAGVQAAWMQWRSTNCQFDRDPEAGSLKMLQELQCQARMTGDRADELEKLIEQR